MSKGGSKHLRGQSSLVRKQFIKRTPLVRKPRQKSAAERWFDAWLRYQGCIVCAKRGHAPLPLSDVAHVATSEGPRAGKVPLCPWHHRREAQGGGPYSHHTLGKKFWVHHFGAGATSETWVNYFRNRYEAEMKHG